MKYLKKKGVSITSLQYRIKQKCKGMLYLKKRASMTVEASLVVPLFMFVILNLISIINIYEIQSETSTRLYKEAKCLATVYSGDYVKLRNVQTVKPMVGVVGFDSFQLYSYMQTRSWTGYDNTIASKDGNIDETLVYVTKTGKVYHVSLQCTSLKLSLVAVYKNDVGKKRNESGEKFTPCEVCGNKENGEIVYISKYGNKYHTTLECSTIKRTIEAIPISQVGNRKECSKCGVNVKNP